VSVRLASVESAPVTAQQPTGMGGVPVANRLPVIVDALPTVAEAVSRVSLSVRLTTHEVAAVSYLAGRLSIVE
jgi:hypothetical protein